MERLYVPNTEVTVPSRKFIVNIIGLPGSGKSSLCEHIVGKGAEPHRPSDAIRQYAQANNRPLRRRQDYQDCHVEMVAADPDAMIRSVLESSATFICIDGLRAVAPTQKLQRLYDAITIALDCPFDERLMRVLNDATRHGHRKMPTPEGFRADEAPDEHNDDPNMVSMDDMFKLADYHIDASQSPEQVRAAADAIIDPLYATFKAATQA